MLLSGLELDGLQFERSERQRRERGTKAQAGKTTSTAGVELPVRCRPPAVGKRRRSEGDEYARTPSGGRQRDRWRRFMRTCVLTRFEWIRPVAGITSLDGGDSGVSCCCGPLRRVPPRRAPPRAQRPRSRLRGGLATLLRTRLTSSSKGTAKIRRKSPSGPLNAAICRPGAGRAHVCGLLRSGGYRSGWFRGGRGRGARQR